VDRPWTAAPGTPELRPPAAPVSTGAGQEVGEGEERGEVWSAPGVLEVAFIGPREGAGGVAGVTAAMNGY
jgi:hypothetical protein